MSNNSPRLWLQCDTDFHSNVIKAMIPLALLTAGTGGMMTGESAIYAKQNWSLVVPGISIEHTILLSAQDQLKHIRKIFKLNISELTNILGVSRPTIYSWIQGGAPKADAFNKITNLYNTAKDIEKLQIVRIDLLMHTPIFLGKSLFDKLSNNENISEYLSDLKKISEKNDKSRLESKGSKNTKQIDSEDYSTPLYSNIETTNTKPTIKRKGSTSGKQIDHDDYSTPFYRD